MAEKEFHSNSTVLMPDGTIRRLDSFTEEERLELWRRANKRVERVLQDRIRRDPGLFDILLRDFRAQGIPLVTSTEPYTGDSEDCA